MRDVLIMIDLKGPHERALQKLENAIIAKVSSNVPPPNAQSTIDQKGSSKTLNDTGEMLGHITHRQTEVEGALHGEVGIFDENVAKRAKANEYGVPWENRPGKGRRKREECYGVEPTETSSIAENRAWFIPPRPFMRPAIDETADKAREEMAAEIFNQISKKFGRR